jgi:hypothetical protein
LTVVEVNKPNRHNRRRRRKSDPIDAAWLHEQSSPARHAIPNAATVPSRRSASSESPEQLQ